MKELLQMEIGMLRQNIKEAKERGDTDSVEKLATRMLQLQSNLHRINRTNWYRR